MFDTLKHLARVYVRLLLLQLRARLEYASDFWMGFVGSALRHSAGLVFLWTILHQVPQVKGWTLWELVLLYCLSIIPMGLVELFYDGVVRLAEVIHDGDLDRLLLRPVPAGLQIITLSANPQGLGTLLTGGVLLSRALAELHLSLAPWQYLFLIVSQFSSMLLIGSLYFMIHCLAFWEPVMSLSLTSLAQEMLALSRFPLSLYNQLLRVIITWLVPFAFIAYFPGAVLLGRAEVHPLLGYGAPVVGVGVTLLSGLFWMACLRRYQGMGT